ncbi:MAG TPA: DNA repair protein RecN [Clostridia bacterium]|nr:DNA repair protein RecN [Clostridia bacterium]
MLYHLKVRNIALIDSLEIDFSKGLNVITGETGAGKSVIVDSVNLALGERADRTLIRSGQDSAYVEAVFKAEEQVMPVLEQNGLDADDLIIISREVFAEGHNICRVNGRTVTLSLLREITAMLVDMHGQHDHQELLNTDYQLRLLDTYAANELKKDLADYQKLLARRKEIIAELEKLGGDESQREQRIDILRFQIDEIENARLSKDEEEKLAEKKELIQNAERIITSVSGAKDALDGYNRAMDSVNEAIQYLSKASRYDSNINGCFERLQSCKYELEDIADNLRNLSDGFDIDPKELDAIEERLEQIKKLKRKYGGSIDAVTEFLNSAKESLNALVNSEELLKKLNGEKASVELLMYDICNKLSDIRRKAAADLEKLMLEHLADLGMPNATFKVDFAEYKDQIGKIAFHQHGLDSVVFMFSANKGEPPRTLSKIISGGEMSRFMLAIKTIMARRFGVSSMIFDEIDTGISGHTAHAVAKKLAAIAAAKQVICVTHLPQIAAMGDAHFLITKTEDNRKTVTTIKRLADNDIYREIARLAGGIVTDDHSLEHARGLIFEAREYKRKLI